MVRDWLVLFSQTGTEIVSIQKTLTYYPTAVITNDRPGYRKQLNPALHNVIVLPNRPSVEDYEKVFSRYNNPIITLHGWMRIIPPEICSKYEIYNGHPGLITEYPELKGKDPQEKAYRLGYEYGGSVVHRVTEGVDEGEVLHEVKTSLKGLDLNGVYDKLRQTSMVAWMQFFTKLLYEEGYCSSWEFEYWQEYNFRAIEDEVN